MFFGPLYIAGNDETGSKKHLKNDFSRRSKIMKILAIEKELPGAGVASEKFNLHAKAEALRVWKFYQSGVIRELYFRQDRHEAVLILECRDLAEAESLLNTLPLVKEKLIAIDLIPLAPYPGFARLFST